MGIPVRDTVVTESERFLTGVTAPTPISYTPAKPVRALMMVAFVDGANATAFTSAPKVGGVAMTERGGYAAAAAPIPQLIIWTIDLGSAQSGPFEISIAKNTNVRIRCVVIGIRSGSAVTFSEPKGSNGSAAGPTVAAQTVPAGGALAVAGITAGPELPTARSFGALLKQRDEGEESYDLMYAEPASGTTSFSWTFPAATVNARGAILVAGEPPSESKAVGLTDSVSASDAVTKSTTKALTDSVAVSDSFAKKTAKALPDSVAVTDALAKSVAKALEDSVTLSESWTITKVEPEPLPTFARLRVVEPVPMRQYLLITSPAGHTTRWAEDEYSPERVLEGLTDSDSVPGGCKEAAGSVPRRAGMDPGELERGSKVELFGAGRMRLWEGSLQDAARSSGDHFVLSPAATGYQGDLIADESVQFIPIDADMTAWTGPSTRRNLALQAGKFLSSANVGVLPAGDLVGDQSIFFDFTSAIKGAENGPGNEMWYDGGGIDLGTLMFDFIGDGTTTWINNGGLSDDDLGTTVFAQAELGGASAGQQNPQTGSAGAKWAFLKDYYVGSFTGQMQNRHYFQHVKVRDFSGIPIYGTWPNVGVLFSDVFAYALGRWCPGIRFTTGANGTIRPTQFPIPHLPFKEPTTVQAVAEQGNRFEFDEWGIWPHPLGPTAYLSPRGEREGAKRWRVRASEAQLQETGPSLSRACNGLLVQYEDVDGTTKILAPPGSGYRLTSEACVDRDPLNPYNLLGKRRWKKIAMKRKGTNLGAAEVAERYFELIKLHDNSGSMTLTGTVEDDHGVRWPYYCVQAGHLIDPLDGNGYRYIVDSSRTRSSRSSSITLDAPPDSFEAALERLDVEELAF